MANKNWAITCVGDWYNVELQVYGNAPEDAVALYEVMVRPLCDKLTVVHYPSLTDAELAKMAAKRKGGKS